MIPTFVNAPNKTFFGVDRGESHCFTVPSNVKQQLVEYFDLRDDYLQAEIIFQIDGEQYTAEIRMARILNIMPHRSKDRKKGHVLKIQWNKFPETKTIIKDFFHSARNIVLQGNKNTTHLAKFTLIRENIFHVNSEQYSVSSD